MKERVGQIVNVGLFIMGGAGVGAEFQGLEMGKLINVPAAALVLSATVIALGREIYRIHRENEVSGNNIGQNAVDLDKSSQ